MWGQTKRLQMNQQHFELATCRGGRELAMEWTSYLWSFQLLGERMS